MCYSTTKYYSIYTTTKWIFIKDGNNDNGKAEEYAHFVGIEEEF